MGLFPAYALKKEIAEDIVYSETEFVLLLKAFTLDPQEKKNTWPTNASEAKKYANQFIDDYNLSDGPLKWNPQTRIFEIRWNHVYQGPSDTRAKFGELNTKQNDDLLFGITNSWALQFMKVTAIFDPSKEKITLAIDVDEGEPYFYTGGPIHKIYDLDRP